jgi:hypothetical protein
LDFLNVDVGQDAIDHAAIELFDLFRSFDPTTGVLPPDIEEVLGNLVPFLKRLDKANKRSTIARERMLAEAALPDADKITRELLRRGLISSTASQGFLSYISREFIQPAAQQLGLERLTNPDPDADIRINEFLDRYLLRTPSDIFSTLSSQQYFVDDPSQAGRLGAPGTKFPSRPKPREVEGIFADPLKAEGDSPEFLNFLFGKQLDLERDFASAQARLYGERIQEIGENLPGQPIVPGDIVPSVESLGQHFQNIGEDMPSQPIVPGGVTSFEEHLQAVGEAMPSQTIVPGDIVDKLPPQNGPVQRIVRHHQFPGHPGQQTYGKEATFPSPVDQRQIARQLAGKPSLTVEEFFEEQRPELFEEFQTTPAGIVASIQGVRPKRKARTIIRRARV